MMLRETNIKLCSLEYAEYVTCSRVECAEENWRSTCNFSVVIFRCGHFGECQQLSFASSSFQECTEGIHQEVMNNGRYFDRIGRR